VRSREAHRREAWPLIAWEIAVVTILSMVYAAWSDPPWGAVLGVSSRFSGRELWAFQELRPTFSWWRQAWRTDPSFEPILRYRGASRGLIAVMKGLARLGARDYPKPMDPELTPVRIALREAAGFGAIAVGTLVQIIAAWP
jgi:hypothetical protein